MGEYKQKHTEEKTPELYNQQNCASDGKCQPDQGCAHSQCLCTEAGSSFGLTDWWSHPWFVKPANHEVLYRKKIWGTGACKTKDGEKGCFPKGKIM